jgi:ribosomal protein S27E
MMQFDVLGVVVENHVHVRCSMCGHVQLVVADEDTEIDCEECGLLGVLD